MIKITVFPVRIKILHLFTDGEDTYVAFDQEDAEKCFYEFIGETRAECTGDTEIEPYNKIPLFSKVNIWFEDECKKYPLFSTVEKKDKPDRFRVTAPAWAWALFNGRGFLCSTEF